MWKQSVALGGKTLEFETGRIAKQAGGAVLLKEGATVILSTVVGETEASRMLDFLPLTVDYREQLSAIGRIPGSFHRREGRSSDREVLASRLSDRSLRPLFPKGYRLETQVITTVLSYGAESDAQVLGINAAAAAMLLSPVPWNGPLAAIRVGRVEGKLIALPSPEELTRSDIDLVVSLNRDGLVMIEAGARQVADKDMLAALDFAQKALQPVLTLMDTMRKDVGKEKIEIPPLPDPPAFATHLEALAKKHLAPALAIPEKLARRTAVKEARKTVIAALVTQVGSDAEAVQAVNNGAPKLLQEAEDTLVREQVIKKKVRVDGRGPEDIRPIACEVDWLPSPHGSALFTRGETQAMVTLTLGPNKDSLLLESVEGVKFDKFLLHYSFPPYSVGEVRPLRGPGRREVGHGALARRALAPVLPAEDAFPYTIRILSEISESNGSSSMATVCGGCLALMDGGVPIAAPVAGIAMGLIKEGKEVVVLSDILGDEDHLGDMDFKVAGTAQGVTALQMDNKIGSLPPQVMVQAFEQARQGRLHILGEMAKTLEGPRKDPKDVVPRFARMNIPTARIRELIGPGGKVIQEIQRQTGATVEVNDSGVVLIYAPGRKSLEDASNRVQEVAGSMEVGAIYEGSVVSVKEFGAFVRIRGQDGLVHISEWDSKRVEKMADVAKEGDIVKVKVLPPDKQGRLALSRKAAL